LQVAHIITTIITTKKFSLNAGLFHALSEFKYEMKITILPFFEGCIITVTVIGVLFPGAPRRRSLQ